MLSTYEQKSKLKLAATVVTILVIAGVVLLADHIRASKSDGTSLAQNTSSPTMATSDTSAEDPSATGTDSTTSDSSTSSASSNYKDGTYTATSTYEVPHGDEEIEVNLTLSGGTITNVSVQNSEYDYDSARYQEDFAAEYKQYVVGKKIDGLQLNYIAGASDTTEGFNDALSKIASQAQA